MSPRITETDRRRTTPTPPPPPPARKPENKPAKPAAPAPSPERAAPQPTEATRRDGRLLHAANATAQQLRARTENGPRLVTNPDGSQTFHAGSGNNDLHVRQDSQGNVTIRDRNTRRTYTIEGDNSLFNPLGSNRLTIDTGAGNDRVQFQAQPGFSLSTVAIDGGAGNDRIDARGSTRSVNLRGGAGNDILRGGRGGDRLEGGEGNDVVRGHRGADVVIGGTGSDALSGGRGADLIDTDRRDRSIDAGSIGSRPDRAHDVIVQRDFGADPRNVGDNDEVVAYDATAVRDYRDAHPGVEIEGYQGDRESQDRELARLLSTPEGREQLDNVSGDSTIHVGYDGRSEAVRGALAEPESNHVFLNDDGIAQEISIEEEGERKYRVNVRGLDPESADQPTSFAAEFDEGVEPQEVFPSIINDYSESPPELRDSVKTMKFNSEQGPAIETTDDPDDFAGANAADGVINFFNGTRNLSLYDHESAHLIGQDAEGDGFTPEGYDEAAAEDGNYVSPYAEDSSSASGYTEDFADAWAMYQDAIDGGPDALKKFRLQYPSRAEWFETNFPRPTSPTMIA